MFRSEILSVVRNASIIPRILLQISGHFPFTQDQNNDLKFSWMSLPNLVFSCHLILNTIWCILYQATMSGFITFITQTSSNKNIASSATEEFSLGLVFTVINFLLLSTRAFTIINRIKISNFYTNYNEIMTEIYLRFVEGPSYSERIAKSSKPKIIPSDDINYSDFYYVRIYEVANWSNSIKRKLRFYWVLSFYILLTVVTLHAMLVLVTPSNIISTNWKVKVVVIGLFYNSIFGNTVAIFLIWLITILACVSSAFKILKRINIEIGESMASVQEREMHLRWFVTVYKRLNRLVKDFNAVFAWQIILNMAGTILMVIFHTYAGINQLGKGKWANNLMVCLSIVPVLILHLALILLFCEVSGRLAKKVCFVVIDKEMHVYLRVNSFFDTYLGTILIESDLKNQGVGFVKRCAANGWHIIEKCEES